MGGGGGGAVGLRPLEGLTNLRKLDFPEGAITDRGLAHFTGLTKLRWLRLMRTKVRGESPMPE